jgi:hypothetical protein
MIDDFTVNDCIAEIFDFHFGVQVWNNVFDPVKDSSLRVHGAKSTMFLQQ